MLTARRLQQTIARDAEVRGIGFFHGSDVALRFRPAPADTGVVFVRTDLPGHPSVPADIRYVVPRQRRTTLQNGAATVEMVEHVLAALAGLQIDNCVIEIDAPETPGGDGSSRPFVEALSAAGPTPLDRPREVLVLEEPVTVREGPATLTAYPGPAAGEELVLSYHLDYGRQSPIGAQSLFLEMSPGTFASELAPSRTFLLEAEAQTLRQAGVGSRATTADLLIFGSDGVIDNTLRYPDECVRHKILDLLGDLSLLGRDLHGHVVAFRSGHQLNAALVRELSQAVERASEVASRVSAEPPIHDIGAILGILPHRFPFLLIDRVLELEPGRRVLALKNVSVNEPFFQGHWPDRPIMPGVLIVEALAQAAGILLAAHAGAAVGSALIVCLDKVKIRRSVVPGDQLRLEVTHLRQTRGTASVKGVAWVGGQVAAEAKILFALVDSQRAA